MLETSNMVMNTENFDEFQIQPKRTISNQIIIDKEDQNSVSDDQHIPHEFKDIVDINDINDQINKSLNIIDDENVKNQYEEFPSSRFDHFSSDR